VPLTEEKLIELAMSMVDEGIDEFDKCSDALRKTNGDKQAAKNLIM
jgi:hypothetical protein